MPAHTPTTPPPPTTLNLAPGQGFWLCLAPGSTLRTTQGDVAVRWGPQACGQAMHAPPPASLKTGEQLLWNGQAQAVWLQLHNLRHRPAEIQLMEAAPAPGLRQSIWRRLRTTLRNPRQAVEDSGYGGALHTAR